MQKYYRKKRWQKCSKKTKKKCKFIGQILHGKCLEKHIIEGKIMEK
jgi:hypothetical protein